MFSQPLNIADVLMGARDKEQAQFSALEALKAAGAIRDDEPRRMFSGQRMGVEHFWHLAQFCGWEFVPADQNITTQGAIGHSLVILRSGDAVIYAADNSGRPLTAVAPCIPATLTARPLCWRVGHEMPQSER